MFVDASALCAMLTNEDDARDLLTRLQRAPHRITSPAAVWETVINVARILALPLPEIRAAVEDYLRLTGIELVAIPPEAAGIAIEAFERFGKGRHPARLNFGDCLAYACARHYQMPLLFKGEDFALTDVEVG